MWLQMLLLKKFKRKNVWGEKRHLLDKEESRGEKEGWMQDLSRYKMSLQNSDNTGIIVISSLN